jgi:hypothetical protein
MNPLLRGKVREVATAVLNFYAHDDGELAACAPNWVGDERLFLQLPGLAFDEYLPYVRIAHGKLQDPAREAVLDEFEQFVGDALDRVERGDAPPLRDALEIVNDYPAEVAAQATITIRLETDATRLWGETAFAPKKARDVLFFVAPRVCWDWVFTSLGDERELATTLLTDLLLLCDDYRTNGIPQDFSLKGIGRAPYRLWVSGEGELEDLRESVADVIFDSAADGSVAETNGHSAEGRQANDGPHGAALLSAELFDRDPEHEAYWAAVDDVFQTSDRSAIPDIARHMSLNQAQHMLSLAGSDGFDAWIRDLAESFSDAYVLAEAEEWDLDPELVDELIERCMRAVNTARLAVGSEGVSRQEYSTWISIVLNGLHSELSEWEPFNDYLQATGAWERLEWVFPTYQLIGEHVAKPPSEDLEHWRFAFRLAWRNGIFLNLLYRLGYLSAESGRQGFDAGERPLSGTLFELDPKQYQITAGQLGGGSTAHAVPDTAREIYWQLIAPIVDDKLVRNHRQWLNDSFEWAFVLCESETWDDLDQEKVEQLINEGLQRVIREKDTRDPSVLISDPEYRIRNVSYGIASSLPYFSGLSGYLETLGAFQRICSLGHFMVSNLAAGGAMKRRDAEKLNSPLFVSFLLGVSLGLLDQLGELPPVVPQRLL